MTEKWLIAPGQERVIDIERASKLKIGLVGGQVDVIAHDEPGIRIEVHNVTIKDLRIESDGTQIEIDHPQIGWDNFLEVFRNFGAGGPKAEISVAVPRDIALTLGVVSAGALVSGLTEDARLNTVSGDLIVDTHRGDLNLNTVSGDVQVRGLTGTAVANTVSGSVALTGEIRKATIDSVSGAMLIDATGPVNTVSLNSVSGDATVRLDEDLAANYVARTLSGRITIDGVPRGTSGPSNFAGSRGELSGTFADVRVNTVSGDVTVLRRDAAEAPVSFTSDGEDLL
ncbi:DUF4097 family beta strand repeat-containing protein [Microbacterium azadirachtae]|uniref:DUF4097 and DUF4098 domain-containing protein YvlB n=1 Tax=Microbacterium azadirachtae TaxID=582680 RepID=A0A1I6HBC2_9MICO|nr:DUF4097 family beta strand repeat-containing protein [Microbacterium azadirachtae]SFR51753.1 DUF4097 and DUF4098 domain-containing protein YvlB [Microbacterium azadirachtae]